MLFSVLIILETVVTVKSWPCVSPIRKTYSRVNSDAALKFSADLTNLNSPTIFEIMFYDNSIRARITYNIDKTSTTEALSGFSITGNTAGDVVLTLPKVQQNNDGVYTMTSAGFSTKCNCLYILGTPRKPTVTKNKTPSVGESVTLTCSSTSTTTPSNHSLSLTYSWRVDNTDNPGGAKYTYTPSKEKLTVNNIVKEDANKQFTCTATEDVTGGYTSSRSDKLSFDVYYGPNTVSLNVTSPYDVLEGKSLIIQCKAECYPGCSYTWVNVTSGLMMNTTGAGMYIGAVNKYMTGDYKCEAKNNDSSSNVKSADISIRVSVKERTFVKWFYIGSQFNTTVVTVDELEVGIIFTCTVSGDPAENIKITHHGQILKEEQNASSLKFIHNTVNCYDSGAFECEAKSRNMDISSKIISMFVRCSPRPVRKIRENITCVLDAPVTLTFEALAYPEPGSKGFTWYRQRETRWLQILTNEDFQISSSALKTNLTIFNVSENDYGQYRVTSENDFGSYNQYFYLLRHEPASPKVRYEDCTSCDTLTIGIVLGTICFILTIYAASVTIIWKRNVSSSKNQSTTMTMKDIGIERGIQLQGQTAYVNVASASNDKGRQEFLQRHIESKATFEEDPSKTQYTDLDSFSRDKGDNVYDAIKRN